MKDQSSQPARGAKILAWPKSTTTRYTYRYERNGRSGERHYGTLDEAIERAVLDVQDQRCVPICIKCDGKMLMDPDQIYDAWSDKHLGLPELPVKTNKPTG